NSFSKRARALITSKIRYLLINLDLLLFIWPKTMEIAIYILNRMLNKQLNWETPYRTVWKSLLQQPLWLPEKPDLSYLRKYRSHVYTWISNLLKGDKLGLRALIGFLVGYRALNI
ncbi:uncharacterized protein BP01DRAFT_292538, partial [Aspergillus saccharolyticus JOP 1030-1]